MDVFSFFGRVRLGFLSVILNGAQLDINTRTVAYFQFFSEGRREGGLKIKRRKIRPRCLNDFVVVLN